jgi:hypothetical protein
LPKKHLARFIVEVIEGLDLRAMIGAYRGSGSAVLVGSWCSRRSGRSRQANGESLSNRG